MTTNKTSAALPSLGTLSKYPRAGRRIVFLEFSIV